MILTHNLNVWFPYNREHNTDEVLRKIVGRSNHSSGVFFGDGKPERDMQWDITTLQAQVLEKKIKDVVPYVNVHISEKNANTKTNTD